MAVPSTKPGYRVGDREVRLTRIQGDELTLCAIHPQRRPQKPSWTWRQLLQHEFVTSEPHYSERLKRHTNDVIYTITAAGRRYMRQGRDR